MSSQIEKLIGIAEQYLGVKESPPNSNNVLFNTAYYGRTVSGSAYPWCMAYVWYIFREAGLDKLFYDGGKTASCTTLMNWAKQRGKFYTKDFRRGDVVLFNWSGAKTPAQHVGIITAITGNGVQTVEGNTAVGNDSDGGEVMRRTRNYNTIIGVYRPDYKEDEEVTQVEFNKMLDNYFAEKAKKEESDWSDKEGHWKKAVAAKVFDGTKPQSPLTREQAAAVLGRLGLIR